MGAYVCVARKWSWVARKWSWPERRGQKSRRARLPPMAASPGGAPKVAGDALVSEAVASLLQTVPWTGMQPDHKLWQVCQAIGCLKTTDALHFVQVDELRDFNKEGVDGLSAALEAMGGDPPPLDWKPATAGALRKLYVYLYGVSQHPYFIRKSPRSAGLRETPAAADDRLRLGSAAALGSAPAPDAEPGRDVLRVKHHASLLRRPKVSAIECLPTSVQDAIAALGVCATLAARSVPWVLLVDMTFLWLLHVQGSLQFSSTLMDKAWELVSAGLAKLATSQVKLFLKTYSKISFTTQLKERRHPGKRNEGCRLKRLGKFPSTPYTAPLIQHRILVHDPESADVDLAHSALKEGEPGFEQLGPQCALDLSAHTTPAALHHAPASTTQSGYPAAVPQSGHPAPPQLGHHGTGPGAYHLVVPQGGHPALPQLLGHSTGTLPQPGHDPTQPQAYHLALPPQLFGHSTGIPMVQAVPLPTVAHTGPPGSQAGIAHSSNESLAQMMAAIQAGSVQEGEGTLGGLAGAGTGARSRGSAGGGGKAKETKEKEPGADVVGEKRPRTGVADVGQTPQLSATLRGVISNLVNTKLFSAFKEVALDGASIPLEDALCDLQEPYWVASPFCMSGKGKISYYVGKPLYHREGTMFCWYPPIKSSKAGSEGRIEAAGLFPSTQSFRGQGPHLFFRLLAESKELRTLPPDIAQLQTELIERGSSNLGAICRWLWQDLKQELAPTYTLTGNRISKCMLGLPLTDPDTLCALGFGAGEQQQQSSDTMETDRSQ